MSEIARKRTGAKANKNVELAAALLKEARQLRISTMNAARKKYGPMKKQKRMTKDDRNTRK